MCSVRVSIAKNREETDNEKARENDILFRKRNIVFETNFLQQETNSSIASYPIPIGCEARVTNPENKE